MVIIGQRVFPRSEFDVMMGRRLQRARRDAGLTQIEAADCLGVRPDTVSKWELGVRRPGLEMLTKIVKLYRVDGGLFLQSR